MLQTRNYTIRADSTKTLRPESQEPPQLEEPCTSKPKKVPRHLEPKVLNVVTLDEATRNKMKHRYRIVIGKQYVFQEFSADLQINERVQHPCTIKPKKVLQLLVLFHIFTPY